MYLSFQIERNGPSIPSPARYYVTFRIQAVSRSSNTFRKITVTLLKITAPGLSGPVRWLIKFPDEGYREGSCPMHHHR